MDGFISLFLYSFFIVYTKIKNMVPMEFANFSRMALDTYGVSYSSRMAWVADRICVWPWGSMNDGARVDPRWGPW